MRNYVTYYAQKVEFLQHRKVALLRLSSFNKNRQRKLYVNKTILKFFTKAKLNSYRQLQKIFNKTKFLIHFDRNRVLYIDIDVLKRRNFDVIIYHLKNEASLKKSRRDDIKFIIFLDKFLNTAKINY